MRKMGEEEFVASVKTLSLGNTEKFSEKLGAEEERVRPRDQITETWGRIGESAAARSDHRN
jgi:hypothetical protein